MPTASMSGVTLTTADGRTFTVRRLDTLDPITVTNGRFYVNAEIELPTTEWPGLSLILTDCTLAMHSWKQIGVAVKTRGFSIPADGMCTFRVIMSWPHETSKEAV